MRRAKSLTAAAAALLLAVAPARAGFQTLDVGTTGAQFLELGAGARAEGMGGAYGAVVDDADSIYWNPAGLARVHGHSASFMAETLPAGINYEYLGYGQSIGKWGGVGGAIQYLTQPGIDQTDATGASTGSTFHPNDLAATFGYGYMVHNEDLGIFDGASFGASVKYVQSTITKTADTFALDLGFVSAPFQLFDRDVRLSYGAQNLGGQLKFQAASDPLPQNLRLGTAVDLTDSWLLALDVNEPVNNQPYAALGTEYRVDFDGGTFAMRAGFNSRSIGQAGSFDGLSLGLGAKFSSIGFDYAFAPLGVLGMSNYLSLTYSF